jgi:hypothetical protein
LRTPEDWELTGFSGSETDGYFRVDDGDEQGIEVKWGTEKPKSKEEPDPDARRVSYFRLLRDTAKKKKLPFEGKETEPPRYVQRPERNAVGFIWLGDRRATGALWYCRQCRRVVIAQVIGHTSGRHGLAGITEAVLGSLRCHGDDPEWRVWSLYDLVTAIPADYTLASQQLMNVYLRLTFTHKKYQMARLSVEQWALANVARRDAYLDTWLSMNSKAELKDARYTADEGELNGHPTLLLTGGPAIGTPMLNVAKQVSQFHRPATKFRAVAWECEPSNKLYLVEAMRPGRVPDVVEAVAERTRCHDGLPESAGGAA